MIQGKRHRSASSPLVHAMAPVTSNLGFAWPPGGMALTFRFTLGGVPCGSPVRSPSSYLPLPALAVVILPAGFLFAGYRRGSTDPPFRSNSSTRRLLADHFIFELLSGGCCIPHFCMRHPRCCCPAWRFHQSLIIAH